MTPQHMAYQAYNQASHTVGKTRQIVMLYDGIIRFVSQAKQAIEEKRIEDRFNLLVKASEVIAGLQTCLDFENGDLVASSLYDFYSSIDYKITRAQMNNDAEICNEIISELREMRNIWDNIDKNDATASPVADEALKNFMGTTEERKEVEFSISPDNANANTSTAAQNNDNPSQQENNVAAFSGNITA